MMNPKTLAPQLQPPVDRVPTGQLPSALAELSEAELGDGGITATAAHICSFYCSYDGDDE